MKKKVKIIENDMQRFTFFYCLLNNKVD